VTDKKPGSTRPLSEVREQIADQLRYDAAARQVTELAQKLAGEIRTPAELEGVAKAQGVTLQESEFFGRNDPLPGLGLAPAVAARAFDLGDNQVSGAVRASRGEVLFTVTGKQESYIPQLDEVRDRVREDVVRQKSEEMAKQRATDLAATLQKAADFDRAAKAAGFAAQTTELVGRNSALPGLGVSPAVDRVAFSLPVAGVSQPIRTENGYGVVKVLEKQEPKPEEIVAARETFREELLNEHRSRFFVSYMERATQKMLQEQRIQVYEDALQRATGLGL
jgi:parvulin-like peptidyl-prolyl isomerase